MRYVKEPTYKRYITGELKRFDDRNTAFSRGATEGDLYNAMHEKAIENVEKVVPGKTILDHAKRMGARTVDYTMRKETMGRERAAKYNVKYRLEKPDPSAMTRIIKETASWFGADLVGVAELNELWVYTHWGPHNVSYTNAAQPGDPIEIPPECNRVIVLIHEMGYEIMRLTPAIETESDIAYSKMAWSVSSLATFVTELGYRAIPAGNELGLSIPMAVDAGLGELARNGQLITREFGPRVRISKVFTDLPLIPDTPIDIGVQEFCEKCVLCAKYCPSRSIPSGHRTDEAWDISNVPGMLKWPVQAMSCLEWWAKNGVHCSVCIRVCPWNKPNTLFHRAVKLLAERNILTRCLVFMDDVLGYGKQVRSDRKGQDPAVVGVSRNRTTAEDHLAGFSKTSDAEREGRLQTPT